MNGHFHSGMSWQGAIGHTIVALLFTFVSPLSMDSNDAYNYALLVQEVRDYYKATCVIIVQSDGCGDLNHTSTAYTWSRAFSRRGISTMIVSFSDLSRETKKYQGYVVRPLYVVVLATVEAMKQFSLLTGQIDISFPFWLVMFLPYRENRLRNVCERPVGNPFNLLFDTEMLVLCHGSPVLTEWYATRENRTRSFDLATWSSGQGLSLRTNRSLYARRNDLFGQNMRISVVQDSRFIKAKNGVLSLFLGEVVRELSKSMNFTIEVVSSMSTYGSWNEEEHTWTGVIGEVTSRRADFGVAEFSMTKARMEVVDFTLPLILSRNRIYFKKPNGASVQWAAYFKTFDADIWMAIGCLILSTPILLTVMKTRGPVSMKILADNYIHVWGIYCQQGLSDFPDESSMRLAFLSIFMSALIVLSAYSASLISFLTVSTIGLPFSTIEEFATYSSYKLIVFRNSADYDMIISANNSVFSNVKKQLKQKEDLPVSVHEAFTQVCTEKVGFYVTEAIRNAVSNLPCETVYIEGDRTDMLAPVLTKRSPYTEAMNYHLQRFKDNGMLNRLRNTFLETRDFGDKGYPIVTLDGIAPILAVLAIGVLLSCLVLTLERMYLKYLDARCNASPSSIFWRKVFAREFSGNDGKNRRRIRSVLRDMLEDNKMNERLEIYRNENRRA